MKIFLHYNFFLLQDNNTDKIHEQIEKETKCAIFLRWRVAASATRDHSLLQKTQSQDKDDLQSCEDDEKWHSQICSNFIHEYKQYLQCLGFFPIQPSESFSRKL